jgi:hypothetical protein
MPVCLAVLRIRTRTQDPVESVHRQAVGIACPSDAVGNLVENYPRPLEQTGVREPERWLESDWISALPEAATGLR